MTTQTDSRSLPAPAEAETVRAPELGVSPGSHLKAEATLKKLFRRDKRLYCYCFRQTVYHFQMTGGSPTRAQTDIVAAWYAETLMEVFDEYAAEASANVVMSRASTNPNEKP